MLGYLVKDGSVLLLFRENTTVFSNCYALPGGKVEADETPSQALKRELEEELGISIAGETPLVHVMYFEGITRPCIVFVFRVDTWSGDPYNKEPHKHSHVSWFLLNDIPSNILLRHGRIIAHIQSSNYYVEEIIKD